MDAKIFPNELWRTLPPLGSQEGISDPIVYIKFLTFDADWAWYVTEGSPEGGDVIFFGFVIGFGEEWGDFWLSELAAVRGPSGLPVARDLCFEPAPFSQVMARENRWNTAWPAGNLQIGSC
jgi:hypothetical protein